MKEKYYFTFLQSDPNKDHYVVIEGTYSEAREEMFRRYGSKWAFQYSEEQWKIKRKDDPTSFKMMCIWNGLDPSAESYTQAELFGLTQI